MSENWVSYFTNVNEALSSIRLNLGLKQDAPDSTRAHLLWLWLSFRYPRADGLSSKYEAEKLWEIEDSLKQFANERCGAVLGGCITTLGRREFYFYGSSELDWESGTRTVLDQFPDYVYSVGSKVEPNWNQYLDLLYPSDDQLDAIGNEQVLWRLEDHGDDHALQRPVIHLAYFSSEVSRGSFVRDVMDAGYSVSELPPPANQHNYPYAVWFERDQAVLTEEINQTTKCLRTLAALHDGHYDGWETQAMQSNAKPN